MEQSPDHLGVEKPWLLLLQQLDVWKDGSMYLEWGTVRDHPYCTRFHQLQYCCARGTTLQHFLHLAARQKEMVIYEKKMVDLAVGFRLCYDRAAWMCGRFCP